MTDTLEGVVVSKVDALNAVAVSYGYARRTTYAWARACKAAQDQGASLREIAAESGDVSKDTVSRAIKALSHCETEDDWTLGYSATVKAINGRTKEAEPKEPEVSARVQEIIRLEAEADALDAEADRLRGTAEQPKCYECKTPRDKWEVCPPCAPKRAARYAAEEANTRTYRANVVIRTQLVIEAEGKEDGPISMDEIKAQLGDLSLTDFEFIYGAASVEVDGRTVEVEECDSGSTEVTAIWLAKG
jgi:hypothetical protein